MAWRLAICPTRRSPFSVNATIEGVVRLPSLLGTTTGSPLSMTATQLLVVPRSIPMTFAMVLGRPPWGFRLRRRRSVLRHLRLRVRLGGGRRRGKRRPGDHHERRAHQPLVEHEAPQHLGAHRVRRDVLPLLVTHGLVHMWIERLAPCRERLQALLRERVLEQL